MNRALLSQSSAQRQAEAVTPPRALGYAGLTTPGERPDAGEPIETWDDALDALASAPSAGPPGAQPVAFFERWTLERARFEVSLAWLDARPEALAGL